MKTNSNGKLHAHRQQLKKQRKEFSNALAFDNSESIASKFWQSSFTWRVQNIAVYMATAGEVDCQAIAEGAWLRKKNVFVPILRGKHLNFAPLYADSKLTRNRFDILEPVYQSKDLIAPRQLDIVVTPLLAFDKALNRIGMGAGFYDRSFAFTKHRKHYCRPRLVGVAHSFQQVDWIQPEVWDVPLHAVITERESLIRF